MVQWREITFFFINTKTTHSISNAAWQIGEGEKIVLIVFRFSICLLVNNTAICGLFSFDDRSSGKWSNVGVLLKMNSKKIFVTLLEKIFQSSEIANSLRVCVCGKFCAATRCKAARKIVLQAICAMVTSNQMN